MIIEINDTKTIDAIRKEFSEQYPFLKIEFYDVPHRWQEKSTNKHLVPHDKTIGAVRTKHNPGAMEIMATQKTGAVEQEFKKRFGLNVQLFRCHGEEWVQTAGTDELTLEEQDEIGQKASQAPIQGTNTLFEREKPF